MQRFVSSMFLNRTTSNPEWGKCRWAVFEKTSLKSQISEWPLASVYVSFTKLLQIYWSFHDFYLALTYVESRLGCIARLGTVMSSFWFVKILAMSDKAIYRPDCVGTPSENKIHSSKSYLCRVYIVHRGYNWHQP